MNTDDRKQEVFLAWILGACITVGGGCSSSSDAPGEVEGNAADVDSSLQVVDEAVAVPTDASAEIPSFGGVPLPAGANPEKQLEPIGYYQPGEHKLPDPIKTNGEIFVDWPQPDVALVISGEQMGFFEPCGCAGLENQKGGMKRRHTLAKQLVAHDWPLVAVDLGGQIRRYGPQAVIKYRMAIETFVQLGYQAVGFGVQDLRLRPDDLIQIAANIEEGHNPFVSANVGLIDWESGFVAEFHVVNAGGRSIGFTSVLGESYRKQLSNDDLVLRTPAEGLKHVLPTLHEQADFLVLLSYATPEESQALAREFPDFDIVVTAGGAEEPPFTMASIEGAPGTQLVEVGHKGMYVVVLGLFDDPEVPIRYQRVPLDTRFEDSPEMQTVMVGYQQELETLTLSGLGVKEIAHESGRTFVGSATCVECHTEANDVWSTTPHAHATETLMNLVPPRHYDPECLSCHVTGWDPQGYFPFTAGYTDMKNTPQLRTNGCENCHGPGSAHVAAEIGDIDATDDEMAELRAQLRLSLIEGEAEGALPDGVVGAVSAKCRECHDLDNSPDFDFKTYWPEVEHYGKE